MKRLTPVALIFSAALLACAPPLAAQETRATPAEKNLALDIEGEPERGYQIQVKGGLETSHRPLLPRREQPANAPRLTAVRIDTDYEGDAVRINLSVVFDDSWPPDAPGPKYGRKVQAVASYLAREGESVRLEELARFGVEPMTLRVVQARPRPAEVPPLASTPQVVNNLKAVQVVGFHRDASAPNVYKLRLHNVSGKGIAAMSFRNVDDGGGGTITSLGRPARPLVAPGDVNEMPFNFTVNRRQTPQGETHDAERPRTLVVTTAVFDDGTYEGEAEMAAGIIARWRGDETQRARILPLLRAPLAAPSLAASALDKLKSEVESLRIDADPAAVAELAAKFPTLARDEAARREGRDAVALLSSQMMEGFRSARESALYRIREWEEERARAPEAFDFRARLAAFVERLEKGGRR
ncbi:MAG TPA: hypothetical protein VK421_02810 [Pyrinomonadaceae bacterium]|nr:hypothetical protein [Pyrinomonadaceae bacterium]